MSSTWISAWFSTKEKVTNNPPIQETRRENNPKDKVIKWMPLDLTTSGLIFCVSSHFSFTAENFASKQIADKVQVSPDDNEATTLYGF
jgi:hypothetical protein